MNYITKSNKDDDYYVRKKGYRNLLTKKISEQFKKDSFLHSINPFSEQLTPWNGSSKLQTSINLLKQQVQSRILSKHQAAENVEPSVQHIVSHDSIDYSGLTLHYSRQQLKQTNSRYNCPRLKINSQEVIVSKEKKDEAKRLLFHKKSILQNKKTKKIANLTIQWDDDIIYNPQKKYFQEQNLKRKILRQFSQTRNENRHENSKKDLKYEDKAFKLEFKNNRIHRKQVTIFQFKKHEKSLSPVKDHNRSQRNQQIFNQDKKDQKQKQSQVRVSNLSFQPIHSRVNSPELQLQNNPERAMSYNSEKWKFRSSIRAKRNVLPQKGGSKNISKNQLNDKTKPINEETNQNGENQALNRITLQLNERSKDHCAPFQIMAKTSPLFFKKTIE